MKSVTEFANVTLVQGLQARTALAAEGKTPEEVQAGLGEKYKYEGDKLKFFINALDVAATHAENLKRVMVMSLAEGEAAPQGGTQVEEHVYVPEFHITRRPVETKAAGPNDRKGGRGGKKREGGQKESPWGLSPEQKAAKKGPKTPA